MHFNLFALVKCVCGLQSLLLIHYVKLEQKPKKHTSSDAISLGKVYIY